MGRDRTELRVPLAAPALTGALVAVSAFELHSRASVSTTSTRGPSRTASRASIMRHAP